MTPSNAPAAKPEEGEFVRWIEEKSETMKAGLRDKFPPATSGVGAIGPETFTQRIEEVLLGHEPPAAELLEELAALDGAPPLSDEELARQALADGGVDGNPDTPE